LLYILYGLFFIACLVLVATVLLQPGKTDAGALFTSNVSSAAFGPRGTASILSKITIVAASVFMVSAFLISMPALQGNVSVLQTVTDTTTDPGPAVVDSNSNSVPTEPNPQNAESAPASNQQDLNATPANNAGNSPANN